MANEYVTANELRATLDLGDESYADGDIALALTAASRAIDRLTDRRFWVDANANQVRYYTPPGSGTVWVDDLVTLTTLKVDLGGDGTFEETWTLNTDFTLEPLNAAADGRPWTQICVHPRSGRYFACYPRSVEVTGKFGWPAVPDAIKMATSILASKLLRRARDSPLGVIAFGLDEGAATRIAAADPDMRFLTDPYVRSTH